MTNKDATQLYLKQINARPQLGPVEQLQCMRQIDRLQRRLNQCLAQSQVLWRPLAEQLVGQDGDCRLLETLARWVGECSSPTGHVQRLCGLLQEPTTTAHQIEQALGPLRLRRNLYRRLLNNPAHSRIASAPKGPGRGPAPAPAQKPPGEARHILLRLDSLTEDLVQANQRLVANLARQYRQGPVSFMDLVQEGNLGLLRALERFDPERGTRVATYAVWWVRRAMVYALARQGRDVRPSLGQYWGARQLVRAHQALESDQGQITTLEAARRLGVSSACLQQAKAALVAHVTWDANGPGEYSEQQQAAFSTLPALVPEQAYENRELSRLVQGLLQQLPARHAAILRMRFGIDLRDDCTLEQIAQQQGVSRERIRQLEAQALKILRRWRSTASLRDFLT